MAYGNVAAVQNLLEGVIGTDLANTGTTNQARSNQGVAMLPQLLRQVATRADFANTANLKIYTSFLGNTTATIAIESVATQGVLAIAWDNSDSVDGYLVVYGTAAGTIGTTQQAITLYMKTATQGCVVFPQPQSVGPTNTGLGWNVTTNVTPGATASTASKVSVVIVYAK